MLKFFHHLFNPHCEKCEADSVIAILKYENSELRAEKKALLEQVLSIVHPVQRVEVDPMPIRTSALPFRARAKAMEEADRIAARAMRENDERFQVTKESISALEKELEVAE